MENKIISEEPNLHWNFLNFNEQIVLDLGCGKFYSSISTAEWFVENGAGLVVGVDLSDIGYQSDRFIMKVMNIDSTQKIKSLIDLYYPSVLKIDIEGAEIYLYDIPHLASVNQIGIEYHNEYLKELCERKFIDWGFKNTKLYQLFDESTDRIGVYYAWK